MFDRGLATFKSPITRFPSTFYTTEARIFNTLPLHSWGCLVHAQEAVWTECSLWRFLIINRSLGKSPSGWHFCQQEAERHGSERRVWTSWTRGSPCCSFLSFLKSEGCGYCLILRLGSNRSSGSPACSATVGPKECRELIIRGRKQK